MVRYTSLAFLVFWLLSSSASAAPDQAVAGVLKQNAERIFACYRLRLMPTEGICVSLDDLTLANANSAEVVGKYLSERLANNISKRRFLIIPAKLNMPEDVYLSCENTEEGPADVYLTLEPTKAQQTTFSVLGAKVAQSAAQQQANVAARPVCVEQHTLKSSSGLNELVGTLRTLFSFENDSEFFGQSLINYALACYQEELEASKNPSAPPPLSTVAESGEGSDDVDCTLEENKDAPECTTSDDEEPDEVDCTLEENKDDPQCSTSDIDCSAEENADAAECQSSGEDEEPEEAVCEDFSGYSDSGENPYGNACGEWTGPDGTNYTARAPRESEWLEQKTGKVWARVTDAFGGAKHQKYEPWVANAVIGPRGDCIDQESCPGAEACMSRIFSQALADLLAQYEYDGCNADVMPAPGDFDHCYGAHYGELDPETFAALLNGVCEKQNMVGSYNESQGYVCLDMTQLNPVNPEGGGICSNPYALCTEDQALTATTYGFENYRVDQLRVWRWELGLDISDVDPAALDHAQ